MNFTEEERQELEEQYADIDPKLIQIQILMELTAIRRALAEGVEETPKTTTYQCKSCHETIRAEKRKQHAMQEHNAPDMPVKDYGLFSPVE